MNLFYPHQYEAIKAGLHALDHYHGFYVHHGVGCLAGDTEVIINRAGIGRRYPLAYVVAQFNGVNTGLQGQTTGRRGRGWDLTIPTMIQRQHADGTFRLAQITGAWCSGVKDTYTLTTNTGRSIRATAEHPFSTPHGWKLLEDLDLGDEVYVRGSQQGGPRKPKPRYPYEGKLHAHPFARKQGRVDLHRLVAEARLNEMRLEDFIVRVRHEEIDDLQFLDPKTHHVHHRDHDSGNAAASNLEALTAAEHRRLHAEELTPNVLYKTATERIVAIEPYGRELTYDIEVADEPHNFTANGFVVHNSGKTLTALALARLRGAKKILVVVGPVVALGVWRRELRKWWPDQEQDAELYLINVDKLNEKTTKEIVKRRFDLLIFDEAHYAKTPSAQRTRTLWKLRRVCTDAILLSGTPAHNILDYWAQYRLIDAAHPLWAQSYTAYKQEVAKWKGPEGRWFDGPKAGASQMVAEVTAPYTHHFDTRDLHLPEPIWTEVPVPLYPEESRAYLDMLLDFRAEIQQGKYTSAPIILTQLMRLHQISSGHATEFLGVGEDHESLWGEDIWSPRSAKLDALLGLLADRTHQKVVVACKHRSEIDRISQALLTRWPGGKTMGPKGNVFHNTNIMVIDSRYGPSAREMFVDRFTHHDEPQVIVMQPKSGGISIDLTAADCLINYSMEPSSIVWQQLLGRVYRMGQTTHVQILSLLAEGTIDWTLFEGLQRHLEENDLQKYLVQELTNAHA